MEKTPKRRKPGPHEKRHSLQPLTFNEALGRLLKAKPKHRTKRK